MTDFYLRKITPLGFQSPVALIPVLEDVHLGIQ